MNEDKTPTYGELYAENFRLNHNYQVLSNRIDKAIEYIEKDSTFLNDDEYEVYNKKELLEILKGSDN